MGANLARNAARNGANVVVFNRTREKVDAFMREHGQEGVFIPCYSLADLVKALTPPRSILLMVKAGDAVPQMIEELLPLLAKGDSIIDGGNSHDVDTMVRVHTLEKQGIHFLGMGVSGGEEGALHGPSMMPGGSLVAYDRIARLLMKMAADDGIGGKCVMYVGPEGSGHFVKMVHNGIEYGIMQLIAESYQLLKEEGNLSNAELADIYDDWNREGYLQSFLMEITAKIFRKKDDLTEGDLIDAILDQAEQKGTGKWTTSAAMNYGVPVPTINAAVDARIISNGKKFRMQRSKDVPVALVGQAPDRQILVADVRSALELSIINTYAQGFQLIHAFSEDKKRELNLSEIARIWRGGCIIRSTLLPEYQKIFAGDLESARRIRDYCGGDRQRAWRNIVALGALRGIPLPAMSASLSYYDGYRTERLPQNLIQAQRDFFGVHTYQRMDKKGVFHTEWE